MRGRGLDNAFDGLGANLAGAIRSKDPHGHEIQISTFEPTANAADRDVIVVYELAERFDFCLQYVLIIFLAISDRKKHGVEFSNGPDVLRGQRRKGQAHRGGWVACHSTGGRSKVVETVGVMMATPRTWLTARSCIRQVCNR